MNKFRILLYACLSVVLFSACSDDDDDYKSIEKKPIGGFMDTRVTVKSDYFNKETQTVESRIEMNRIGEKETVTFQVKIASVDEGYESAFSLAKNEVSVTGWQEISEGLLQIHWAEIPCGKKAKVILSIESEKGDIDLNSKRTQIEYTAEKAGAPIPWVDQTGSTDMILPFDATANKTFTVAMLQMTEPAVQDLVIPFNLNPNGGAVEGTHYKIVSNEGKHEFRVPAGEMSADIQIEVINSAFRAGEVKKLYLELDYKNVDPKYVVSFDMEWWWTTINLGKASDPNEMYDIFMDASAQYEALLEPGENEKEITVSIPDVIDHAASKDLIVPLNLNEYEAKSGTHFEMEKAQMTIKQGSTTGEIVIKVLGGAFESSADNVSLYVELDRSTLGFNYDQTNWWTTIVLGRK